MQRAATIDLLRGFIMILMAIDHTSALVARVHFTEVWGLPFEGYPTLGWWFTRFVSHLCAPGFFFLMGMSIGLFAHNRLQKNWENTSISNYFFKRGGFILLLMFFVEFPAWGLGSFFDQTKLTAAGIPLPGVQPNFLIPTTVLYGLGTCMIIAGFLWRLPSYVLLFISFFSFGFSTWYVGLFESSDLLNPLAVLITLPGISNGAMSLYPIIPWLGVTTFGMACTRLLIKKMDSFYSIMLVTGLVFLGIFVLLRFNGLGNFQVSSFHDWITFFTLIKYPPSLSFIFCTLGVILLLLFGFSKLSTISWIQPIRLFGQTAMFFYLSHLWFYAIVGSFFPEGCSISVMYLIWMIGLIPLYYIAKRFLIFKKAKPNHSLWRMI